MAIDSLSVGVDTHLATSDVSVYVGVWARIKCRRRLTRVNLPEVANLARDLGARRRNFRRARAKYPQI